MADAEALPGTARLAAWFGRTILNIVRGYSQPGDRVLLLAPPAPPQRVGSVRTSSTADPYAGLTEAIWTTTRLGRSVDTAIGSPELGDLGDAFSAADVVDDPTETFDLIITAVHPDATDWLAQTHYDVLLAPTGVLAVLTHCDTTAGRARDPVSVVVRTLRDQSMSWLDHIAVLNQPLPSRAAHLDVPRPSRAGGAVVPAPAAGPLSLHVVHHDLLLFGPATASTATTDPNERTGYHTKGAAESSDE